MSDEPKVYLTDEQWQHIKRHEDGRMREMNRHNAKVIELLTESLSGMSKAQSDAEKRDYFAGQALAGICANSAWNDNFHASVSAPSAQAAYAMADAMIAARKAGG